MGAGHVIRCLALSAALTRSGVRSIFAASRRTIEAMPALRDQSNDVVVIESETGDNSGAFRHHFPTPPAALIVDLGEDGPALLNACPGWAQVTVVIDDDSERQYDCDLVVSPGRCGANETAEALRPMKLIGPRFALLRPEFTDARLSALNRRKIRSAVERILVFVGATDGRNVLPRIVRALAAANRNSSLDVVVGSSAGSVGETRGACEQFRDRVELHVDIDARGMADLCTRADLAVGAGGGAALERASLGLPSIVIITANNQWPMTRLLERADAAIVAGWHADTTDDQIVELAASLISDRFRRVEMSRAAAALCDAHGAYRTAAEIRRRITHVKGATEVGPEMPIR